MSYQSKARARARLKRWRERRRQHRVILALGSAMGAYLRSLLDAPCISDVMCPVVDEATT